MLALPAPPIQRLPLTELDGTVVVAALSPMATAVALVGAVLSADAGDVPSELRQAIVARLRRRDVAALQALAGPGAPPAVLVPLNAA